GRPEVTGKIKPERSLPRQRPLSPDGAGLGATCLGRQMRPEQLQAHPLPLPGVLRVHGSVDDRSKPGRPGCLKE
ncbi:MAG TPA: hypothetical protein VK162_22790, partial [Streptosporangiaceae bacterium]|nr:hypothetical protein [Streptosporangiaceae bacterium]